MISEEQLISALRKRDPDAFTALFEAYSDKVYRLAVGLLEDEMEAEGIVQESFLRLFQHLDQFQGRSAIGTWLYRVAYNAAIDRLRQRQPTAMLNFDADDDGMPAPVILADWRNVPDRLLEDDELRSALDEAIAALPEKYRGVFILREIEGLSTQETAEVTGLSLSGTKVRLHRARLFLRERLAESLLQYV